MLSGLSPMLIALVVILVLSASMSTLSSLVIASSSTLTIDFLKVLFFQKMEEKKQVLTMRILIVVFIAVSSVLALIQYKSSVTFIAQLMGVSWGALAGSFLAPFMYSLYSKKVTKASCWVCFLFSSILMIANIFFRDSFPAIMQSPINCGAIAMLAGLVIVPVVSLFTPKPERQKIFSGFRYRRWHFALKAAGFCGKRKAFL
jgi:SSS family solute:Na+ symporter